MKIGVRGKLFAVSILLIVGVDLVSGVFLEFSLRSWLEKQAELDLWRQARIARDLVELAPEQTSGAALRALAWRLSDSMQARVTLIAPSGSVLADSQMPDSIVPSIDNHLNREEIHAAFLNGHGIAQRFSDTLRVPMLYVALPFTRPDLRGVVRVGMALHQVEEGVIKLRWMLCGAGLVGFVAALCISGLASHIASRALRDLVRHAQKITRGEAHRRLNIWSEDEIGGIAGSFNQIADKLEQVVSTLGHERDQIATILESMREAVLAINQEHRITRINDAAIALLGTNNQPLGATLLEAIAHPELLTLLQHTTMGSEAAYRHEFNIGERCVLARISKLRDNGGSVIVMHDVTELRRLETIRRDFIINASHELRTPVSVIQANAETLLNTNLLHEPDNARPFVEALLRNAERLGRIIADLLNISRVEAGHVHFEQQHIMLRAAAQYAAEVLYNVASKRHITMTIDIDEAIYVVADTQALDQIFLNLLDNAIKYTTKGSHVCITAQLLPHAVRIHVVDNGPGLAPEHLQRVFERFYRADPGRCRDMGGTGLGLSIVKHLCESMEGHVGVDASDNMGCDFWFELPTVDMVQERFASKVPISVLPFSNNI